MLSGGGTVDAGAVAPNVLAPADMTSAQLVRRAKIIETVIELIGEVGADAVQMRDVAQRSGVALGTVYRYFRSKEHLLASALLDWQRRLTRRVVAMAGAPKADPLPGVLDYLRRALRAFHRNPEMTALMLRTMTSGDPESRAALDQMNQTNAEVFDRLLEGIAPQDVPNITFGLNAVLSNALTGLLTGAWTLEESKSQVEWVACALLAAARRC